MCLSHLSKLSLRKGAAIHFFPLKGWALPLWGETACTFCIPEGLPTTWLGLCFTTLLSLMEQKDKRSTQAKESTPCSAESSSSMSRQMWLQDWQTWGSAWSQILPNHTSSFHAWKHKQLKPNTSSHVCSSCSRKLCLKKYQSMKPWLDAWPPSLKFRISLMQLAFFHPQQNMARPAALLKGSSSPTMIWRSGPC